MSVLLVPALVAGLDHHGAERLPTHLHRPDQVDPAAAHRHGFEQPHDHVAASVRPDVTQPLAGPAIPVLVAPGGGSLLRIVPIIMAWVLDLIAIIATGRRSPGIRLTTAAKPVGFSFPPPLPPPRMRFAL